MKAKKGSAAFRLVKALLKAFYPRMEITGLEHLPDGPCVIAANHAQMNGPIACELNFPPERYTWCAGEMMKLKEVPAYAYCDFWSQKPKSVRWFFKLASYVIAPLSVFIFNNASTIGVYRDMRIMSTFRETVDRLAEGARVVIFPEHDQKHNNIIYDFQEGFVDVARFYHRKTGAELCFVPMYIAPRLGRMELGEPVYFCSDQPANSERRRICDHLMQEITRIAVSMPKHTVIPYRNIPRKDYPSNIQ